MPWLTVLFSVTSLYLGTQWVWYHSTSDHQRHHSVHTSMHCWQEQWIQQGYNQTWPPCPARIPSHRYSSTLHLDIQGQYRLFLYRECKISLCIYKDKYNLNKQINLSLNLDSEILSISDGILQIPGRPVLFMFISDQSIMKMQTRQHWDGDQLKGLRLSYGQ